ncbi:MAG TPA: hypothetical protein VNH43_08575, partial [Vicinamibacteria bacterium]|nr:hypothetical protein [Vicinamibacteria bacterium]
MAGQRMLTAGLLRGMLEAVLCALVAAGVSSLLFTNGGRLLAELGRVALFWLPMLVVMSRLSRGPMAGPGLAARGVAMACAGFGVAALLAGFISENPGRLARHVVQFLIVWLPLLAL